MILPKIGMSSRVYVVYYICVLSLKKYFCATLNGDWTNFLLYWNFRIVQRVIGIFFYTSSHMFFFLKTGVTIFVAKTKIEKKISLFRTVPTWGLIQILFHFNLFIEFQGRRSRCGWYGTFLKTFIKLKFRNWWYSEQITYLKTFPYYMHEQILKRCRNAFYK